MPAESRSISGRATRTQSSIQSSSRTEIPSQDGTAAAEKSDQSPLRDGEPDGPRPERRLLLLKVHSVPPAVQCVRPPRAIRCVSVTCP
jgi:hypothetical protein